ncbi:MAG: threonylcarbamoyl-AMP synthase [Peptococcaceae bacterium]|nr:threonylcarbamoyl-AMP synthase [Peptococcaceae bacterium]
MDTKILDGTQAAAVNEAAELLKMGQLVAFPTETVYGLGAYALNKEAVRGIYQAKGRPSDNPLIVHICQKEQLTDLISELPPLAETLMEKFWPGPLTLIFPKGEQVPAEITGGLDTVAVRMPNHPVALALLEACALPIAAPSANRSGKPSPTLAAHVLHDLNGRIAAVVDGGAAEVGLESTVLDITQTVPVILRPGGITKEQLEEVVGQVELATPHGDKKETPRAPGMKYTHYAPEAPVIICQAQDLEKELQEKINSFTGKLGLMLSNETLAKLKIPKTATVVDLGSQNNLANIAANLFAALRTLDEAEVEIIYTEAFPHTQIGSAVMNRLSKAAGVEEKEVIK